MYGPMIGTVAGVGIFIWIGTNGAPSLSGLAVTGLTMMAALVGYAVGYGAADHKHHPR